MIIEMFGFYIEMPLQIQFLDSRSGGHRYFSLRTQESRIQDVCRGLTVMIRVE
jgi:hypothetical protein